MAISSKLLLFTALLFFFFFFVSPSIQASFRPKALVLPVYKDASTFRYVTPNQTGNLSVPFNLTLDLGGQYLWVDCYEGYVLSSYKAACCFSGEASTDYFIGVKGISIQEKSMPLNKTLLSINKEGNVGTKISTVNPYTVMEMSTYKAVVNAFVKEISGIPRVPAVAPFTACYKAKSFNRTRLGPGVPQIDLELPNNQTWRIFGANSMVQVKKDVPCLGFVDGGLNARTSIVIEGHQIEDNLLQFDLAVSKLGFNSYLLFRQTNYGNFNLTSHA